MRAMNDRKAITSSKVCSLTMYRLPDSFDYFKHRKWPIYVCCLSPVKCEIAAPKVMPQQNANNEKRGAQDIAQFSQKNHFPAGFPLIFWFI